MSGSSPPLHHDKENAHLHDWVRETMSAASAPLMESIPMQGSLAASAQPHGDYDHRGLPTLASSASAPSSEGAAAPYTPKDSNPPLPIPSHISVASRSGPGSLGCTDRKLSVSTPLASVANAGTSTSPASESSPANISLEDPSREASCDANLGLSDMTLSTIPSSAAHPSPAKQHHSSLVRLDISEAGTQQVPRRESAVVDQSNADRQSASPDHNIPLQSTVHSKVPLARWPPSATKSQRPSTAQARWSSDGRNRPLTMHHSHDVSGNGSSTNVSPALRDVTSVSASHSWDGQAYGAVTSASSVHSTPPPSISAGGSSSWSLEGQQNRMRYSATESSHARTPSLGDKALLSPDSRIDFETQGIFPSAHAPLLNSTYDIRVGADDWRTRAHDMSRGGSATSPLDGLASSRDRMDAAAALGRPSLEHHSYQEDPAASAAQAPTLPPGAASQGALMGLGGGGHFGPGVRAKVAEVLDSLIGTISVVPELATATGEVESALKDVESTTVGIAEYGCLNSRSMQLMRNIIQRFAERANASLPRRSATSAPSHFFSNAPMRNPSAAHILAEESLSRVDFSIIHEDSQAADFRILTQLLETDPESYLAPHWQAAQSPSLQNHIFHSFVARPFASRVAPRNSLHLGFSLMDLHWSHTPRNSAISLSTAAAGELTAFLTARAHEFKKGGIFVMAYIARSEINESRRPLFGTARSLSVAIPDAQAGLGLAAQDVGSSPTSPSTQTHARSVSSPNARAAQQAPQRAKADIWTTLTNTLAPCLQRLVSCGMLKSDVARLMLVLPMHPRTPRQTQAVLSGVRHLWKVEWSCGLPAGEGIGEGPSEEETQLVTGNAEEGAASTFPPSETKPLRLAHPAWTALEAGALSHVAFAEHMMQLFKNLYETHFRVVLRDRGKMSKGATEFVLDSLWDVLHSRIEDSAAMKDVEVEVSICALRRI